MTDNLAMMDDLITYQQAVAFVTESNRIEGINREPTDEEVEAHTEFMALRFLTIESLLKFVYAYQPNAELRARYGTR